MVDYAGLTPPQIGTLGIGLPGPDSPVGRTAPAGPQLGLNPQQQRVAELMHRANEAEARGQKRTAQKLRREAASLRVFEDGALHDKPPVIQNAPVPSYLEQVTDPGEGLVDIAGIGDAIKSAMDMGRKFEVAAHEKGEVPFEDLSPAAQERVELAEHTGDVKPFYEPFTDTLPVVDTETPEVVHGDMPVQLGMTTGDPLSPDDENLLPPKDPVTNDGGEDLPPSTATPPTRDGGTTGLTPLGEDTDLFEGVFSGGGFGKLKENWANMDQDRKDNIYKMLMTMGGTLMTTPGNFGIGLGTAMGEGVKAFTEYEEADDLMDMKRQKHEMDMMNAGLKYDAARAQLQLAQQRLNDPNLPKAERLKARLEVMKLEAQLKAIENGADPFAVSTKDMSDEERFVAMVTSLLPKHNGDEKAAFAEAERIFRAAAAKDPTLGAGQTVQPSDYFKG